MILRGRYGKKVLYFDGVDDYAESTDTPLAISTPLTIEIYLMHTTKDNFERPLGKGDGFYLFGGWHFETPGSGLYLSFWWNDGTNRDSIGLGELKGFSHKVVVYDYPNVRVYSDGVLYSSKTTTVLQIGAPGYNLRIGRSNNTPYFTGFIPIVRIYNRALTDSEVKRNYIHALNLRATDIRDGLVLELIPDTLDCANNIWVDNSGNGNNATIVGARCVEV